MNVDTTEITIVDKTRECNEVITEDPTTPQMRRCVTL